MFGCIIRSQQYVAKHVLEDLKHLSLELLYVFTVALSHWRYKTGALVSVLMCSVLCTLHHGRSKFRKREHKFRGHRDFRSIERYKETGTKFWKRILYNSKLSPRDLVTYQWGPMLATRACKSPCKLAYRATSEGHQYFVLFSKKKQYVVLAFFYENINVKSFH